MCRALAETAGVVVADVADPASLAALLGRHGWDDVVIKPAVSAASYRTLRVGRERLDEGQEHLGSLAGQVQPGDALLLRTGWSQFADRPDYYRDHFPRISVELAEWLVNRQVRLLGVETPSVADVNDLEEVTAVHKILLGGNVTIVESLTNLDQIAVSKVFFGALPLKIAAGDGAPCRAFAVEGEFSFS